MSISLPIGAAGQSRASIWHAARPVLVFDPEFLPPMRSRLRIGIGRFLCRTPVIWVGAVIVGAVVGGTMALTNPLVYSATGLLLGLGRDEMAAQGELAIIRSDEVMRGVVDRLGVLRVAPDCAGDGAAIGCAVRAVQSRIQARIVGDPNGIESSLMLRLTAIHPDPAIAVAMLDAAVAIDRKIWHAAHVADRADALDPQLAAAQGALDQTLADVAGVRTQAHVTDIAQDLRQAAAEANMIARQDSDLRLRQVAVSAELKAAQSALQTTPETVLDSREVSSGDPGQDARTLLLQLKLQRAHMAQLYARDYPGLAELDHKIETVETAMKMQAKSTTSVTRDVRNPVLVVLSTKAAALMSENAGLVQQRQELQRQFNAASARESSLRGAEQRLSKLQQRQATQEAVVRQLTLSVANLRAEDLLTTEHLAQRRLLQRPEVVLVPWTGTLAATIAGTVAGLLYGLILSLLAWRRRSFRGMVQVSRRALERLERAWVAPAPDDAPQVVSVPLPPSFGPLASSVPAQPRIDSPAGSLASSLQTAASMRMFAVRRERDIKSLGFEGQATGRMAKAGGCDAL